MGSATMIELALIMVFLVVFIVIADLMISGKYSPYHLLIFGMDDDDRKIYNDLKESGAYKSARVVMPNSVQKNEEEVRISPKYKELLQKSERLVQGND